MSEETLNGSGDNASVTPTLHDSDMSGTTSVGQSTETQRGPNDPASAQAAITQKFQEAAELKRQLEAERNELRLQREALVKGQGYTGISQSNAQKMLSQSESKIADLFGEEAVDAFRGILNEDKQRTQFHGYLKQYGDLDAKGQTSYKNDWNKFDYYDSGTGKIKNKVTDMVLNSNGEISLEAAWRAYNPISEEALKKELADKIKQETYLEMDGKQRNTPVTSNNSVPGGKSSGNVLSVADAVELAMKDMGV